MDNLEESVFVDDLGAHFASLQTERQADRQTDRQTGRQTDRQTERQAGRQAGGRERRGNDATKFSEIAISETEY